MDEASAPADNRGTRERILDCAAELYSRHGYGEGSIRNIAAAIGIRGASLYHHFTSKEELTAELLRIAARTAVAELAPVRDPAPGTAGVVLLDAAIAAHLRALFHPKRYLAALVRIYGELPEELRATASRELEPYLHTWVAVLRRIAGPRGPDPEIATVQAFFIFGAINSILDWQSRIAPLRLDDLARILRNLILKGLVERVDS